MCDEFNVHSYTFHVMYIACFINNACPYLNNPSRCLCCLASHIMHLNINLRLSPPVSKQRERVPSPPIILFTLPHLCHRPPVRCYPSALLLRLSFSLLLVSLWPRELLLTRPPPEPPRPVFLPIRHSHCNSRQPSCTKKKKKPKPHSTADKSSEQMH